MNSEDNKDLQANQKDEISLLNIQEHIDLKKRNTTQKEEKKEGTFKNLIKILFKWSTIQLLLAHHPNCELYDSHVFRIGKLRLCRGCTLSYPPAYTLALMFIFWEAAREFFLSEALWIHNLLWFTTGVLLLTIITFFTRKFSIIINDIYKFSRGTLLGFLFIVVIGEARTQTWYLSIIAGVIIVSGLFYLSFTRGKEMEKTCNECVWEAQFNVCPGWMDTFGNLQTSSESSINNQQIQLSKPIKEINIPDDEK